MPPNLTLPRPQQRRPQKHKLKRWIASLSKADEKERNAAAAWLTAAGAAAVGPLMNARGKAPAGEIQDRINKVLHTVVGDPVAGVAVSLAIEKNHLKLDEKTRFTLTFFNLNDKSINFPWGWSSPNVGPFADPWDYIRVVVGTGKDRKVNKSMYVGRSEMCGTFDGPVFQTLAPHAGARARCDVTYRDWYKKMGMEIRIDDKPVEDFLNLSAGNNSALLVKDPGTHRLMFYITFGAEAAKSSFKTVHGDEKADFWTGTIASNEIEVTLDKPDERK